MDSPALLKETYRIKDFQYMKTNIFAKNNVKHLYILRKILQ